jgi:membrane protease YdiL (CAAX protease family)
MPDNDTPLPPNSAGSSSRPGFSFLAFTPPEPGLPRRRYPQPLFGADDHPRPRVWMALLVGVSSILFATGAATIAMGVAATVYGGPEALRDSMEAQRWVDHYAATLPGLFVLVIPGQAMFLLVALGAALLSRQPFWARLGLQRGPLPLWTWGVFLLGTPMIGIVSTTMLTQGMDFVCTQLELKDDITKVLRMMEEVMQIHAQHFLGGLLCLVAVLPGVAEELLFRGYVQTRLCQRWRPVAAIAVSAGIFSLAHLDPVHALGVLPLGIWLGLIAWRADSIWPAIACHIMNNAVAVMAVKYQDGALLGVPWNTLTVLTLVLSVPAFLFSLYVFRDA